MRNYFKFFILSAMIIATVIACQKDNRTSGETEFNASVVKEWYYGKFKKSPEWAGYNSSLKKMKLPDWKQFIYTKFGDNVIVEFPLVKERSAFSIAFKGGVQEHEKRQIANAAISRVLFIKQKSGNIIVREMQYIPDMEYLSRHGFDISRNKIGDVDKNFSGTIIAKKWDGQEVSRSILKDGKIIRRIKSIEIQGRDGAMRTASCPAGWIEVTEYARDCESHLYGDGLFTYECGEWYPTGAVWCYPPENGGTGDPECADPGSVECFCYMIGGCDGDPGDDGDEECSDMNCNDATALLSGITTEELDNMTYSSGTQGPSDQNGILRKQHFVDWEFFKLNFTSNTSVNFSAYYSGVVWATLGMAANGIWKWESCAYINSNKSSGSTPGCIAVSLSAGSSAPFINFDQTLAIVATFNYDVVVSHPCLGGLVSQNFAKTRHNVSLFPHN